MPYNVFLRVADTEQFQTMSCLSVQMFFTFPIYFSSKPTNRYQLQSLSYPSLIHSNHIRTWPSGPPKPSFKKLFFFCFFWGQRTPRTFPEKKPLGSSLNLFQASVQDSDKQVRIAALSLARGQSGDEFFFGLGGGHFFFFVWLVGWSVV